MSESLGEMMYAGVVHPWMCDTMRHLNVRHYVAMFDDASLQLLGRVSGKVGDVHGWADVRMEIEYKRELAVGTLIKIFSHVEAIRTSSITYRQHMCGSIGGDIHASVRVVSVRFDLQKRTKLALNADERERARSIMLHPES